MIKKKSKPSTLKLKQRKKIKWKDKQKWAGRQKRQIHRKTKKSNSRIYDFKQNKKQIQNVCAAWLLIIDKRQKSNTAHFVKIIGVSVVCEQQIAAYYLVRTRTDNLTQSPTLLTIYRCASCKKKLLRTLIQCFRIRVKKSTFG